MTVPSAGAAPKPPLVLLEGVTVSFGATMALSGIDLSVNQGELLVLLGPSGCGKSTLLRAIAGLQLLDTGSNGRISLNGVDMAGQRPDERGVGLMFQDDVLFPHFDVAGNIEFGLRMQGWQPEDRQQRVAEMLDLVGLTGFESRDVATLSGGEAQRVGLARSLAPRPDLLLLDEPFGALDRPLRERLVEELGPLLEAQGVTAIHVTHDHSEAFALGHRVAVMLAGSLVAVDTPEQVWKQPKRVEVAQFLGHRNTFEIAQWERLAGSSVRQGSDDDPWPPGVTHLAVRADLVRVRPASASPHPASSRSASLRSSGLGLASPAHITELAGRVVGCRFAAERYELRVVVDGSVWLEVRSPNSWHPDAAVVLEVPSEALIPLTA